MKTRYGPFGRAGLFGVLVAGVVLALSMGSLAFAADPVAIPVQGPDRYQTAVQASMKFGTASTVVIATGELFPDALGGAALAGAVDGPILLTRSSSVPAEVLAEITRLGASKIYVLGSTAAVSAAAFNQLDAKIAGTPVRLGGADRYATASLVAAETIRLLGSGYQGGAFLATGLNFPDALAASPLMYAKGMPLILSNANGGFSVPAGVTKVKVLGSTSVVPASVVTALGAKYDGRLFGANRYATAKAVAEYGVAQGMVWNNLGVATGQNFPDALCAGPLLGEESSVLLLTTSATIASEPAAALGAHKNAIDQYYLFGGLPALSANVRAQIALILKRNVVPPPPAVGSHDLPALFCAGAGCHDTDLATIHLTDWNDDGETPKCVACHGAGITPTNNCQTCHPAAHEGTHVPITSAEGARLTCTLADCHGSSAIDIHPTCATCHNPTTVIAGKRTCQSCHGDFHPSLPAAHAITSGLCSAATCHGTDVTVMHTNDFRGTGNPPPGCAACHAPGVTPTTDCSVCHFDINDKHNAAAAHAGFQATVAGETSSACVSCHGTDLMNIKEVTGEHVGCSCHAYFEVRGATECASCHEGAHAPHGFVNGLFRGEGWIAASGHNTTTFGVIGAKTKFDGSQGVTLMAEAERAFPSITETWLVEAGFAFATRPAGWPVGSSVAVGDTTPMTTTWDWALDQVFWKADDTQKPADAMVLDHSSVVTCEDCHAGLLAAGPHGAAQNWGLDPDYPGDYTLAELTKYVTANLAYVSATITGQALDTTTAVAPAVPHNVYLKATYNDSDASGRLDEGRRSQRGNVAVLHGLPGRYRHARRYRR